jgi:hypothetical protein
VSTATGRVAGELAAARAALAVAAAEVERLAALESAPGVCSACGRDCGADEDGQLYMHVPLGTVVPRWPAPVVLCPGGPR